MNRLGKLTLTIAAVMLILSVAAYVSLFAAASSLGAIETASQNAALAQSSAAPVTFAASTGRASNAALTSAAAAPSSDVETDIYEKVYRDVNPSVVYIENQAQFRTRRGQGTTLVAQSSGSGFIWDTDGNIVTNNHVVADADRLEVTFSDGIVVEAELVGTDPDSDLAVIRIDPSLLQLAPVTPGNIDDVVVGSRAIAIGNPYGLVGTMTTGIISAIGRSVASDPNDPSSYSIPQVIQTDAAINPGNSGGPLLNEMGELIGVNFQITSSSNSNSGVGFAIPVNIVRRVASSLIESGTYKHAYLGVRGQTYSPAWSKALGFSTEDRGAYISEVIAGAPAARGGLRGASRDTDVVVDVASASLGGGVVYLQSGGDLVTAIDGRPIDSFDDILVYLESFKSPGDKVALSVVRSNGEQAEVTITLTARPASDF